MRRQRKQTKKRSVKATVTGFILIKGVKSSESTKVRKSDVWGCLQRLCHTCLSAVRFRTPFWRFETSKLRFFEMPPDTLLAFIYDSKYIHTYVLDVLSMYLLFMFVIQFNPIQSNPFPSHSASISISNQIIIHIHSIITSHHSSLLSFLMRLECPRSNFNAASTAYILGMYFLYNKCMVL